MFQDIFQCHIDGTTQQHFSKVKTIEAVKKIHGGSIPRRIINYFVNHCIKCSHSTFSDGFYYNCFRKLIPAASNQQKRKFEDYYSDVTQLHQLVSGKEPQRKIGSTSKDSWLSIGNSSDDSDNESGLAEKSITSYPSSSKKERALAAKKSYAATETITQNPMDIMNCQDFLIKTQQAQVLALKLQFKWGPSAIHF